MFKKNISQQEILIAVVIYLISVPFVFQLLEKQYISFGLVKGAAEGFTGKCEKKCKKNYTRTQLKCIENESGSGGHCTNARQACIDEECN
tara:strand:- start:855 stop:1124 length:270 start_codon:yes stop_codon:yes gene_type:complete